jgi:DegV family protein with EDD domain
VRLTAENTALVLDSAADLAAPSERHANWRVVLLLLHFGDQTLRDFVDITPEELYRRMRATHEMPRTSQPPPGDFAELFESLAGFERILCVTVSSRLSGIHGSALVGAEPFGERVVVVDSGVVSGGTVLLADALQRRLERGTSEEELLGVVERFRRGARFVYTLETLEYLARGGRIGRAAALAGGLLDTRPVIELVGGENVPRKRVRGRARSLAELERTFAEGAEDSERLHVGVVHADAREEAARLEARIRELRPRASFDLVSSFGPALGAHLGPGALGLYWFEDDE